MTLLYCLVRWRRETSPRNKGGDFLFLKSQLDLRTFGVVGPMGLWTHYHFKIFELAALKLKNERDTDQVSYYKYLERKFKSNLIYPNL